MTELVSIPRDDGVLPGVLRQGCGGMTLIETLVVGGLFASISLITTLWLSGVADLWWTSSTQAQARTSTHQAVSRMAKELRMATRIRPPLGAPPNLTVPFPPDNIGVTFYLPRDLDGNGTIVDTVGAIEWDTATSVQYVHDAAARQLLRVSGAQQQVVANDVISAVFDDRATDPSLAADEVRIRLTIEPRTPNGRRLQASSTEIVRLRN